MADNLEAWVREADVDGFNFVRPLINTSTVFKLAYLYQGYVLFPKSFEDIVELLVPELRTRGLFWEEYAVPGGTYRENFYQSAGQRYPPAEHIAASYHWAAGVEDGEHRIPEQ